MLRDTRLGDHSILIRDSIGLYHPPKTCYRVISSIPNCLNLDDQTYVIKPYNKSDSFLDISKGRDQTLGIKQMSKEP